MFAHTQHKDFPKGLLRSCKLLAESKIHVAPTLRSREVAVPRPRPCFLEPAVTFIFTSQKENTMQS